MQSQWILNEKKKTEASCAVSLFWLVRIETERRENRTTFREHGDIYYVQSTRLEQSYSIFFTMSEISAKSNC